MSSTSSRPIATYFFSVGNLGASTLRLGPIGSTRVLSAGGISTCAAPTVSPAFIGVGYIIGPELAALNFSGSVVAWGLLIPLLIFFHGAAVAASTFPPALKMTIGSRSATPCGATSCAPSPSAA